MSFLTDDDVNKRARNLFVALVNAPVPVGPAEFLTSVSGSTPQIFFANYQADFPAVVEAFGGWDGGFSGPDATVSGALSETVEFTGTSASIGQLGYSPSGIFPGSVEVTLVNPPTLPLVAGIGIADFNFYNPLVLGGGGVPGQNPYYRSDGFLIGAVNVPAPPLVAGDVVGMVLSAVTPGVTPGIVTFYVNGVNVGSLTSTTINQLMAQTSSVG